VNWSSVLAASTYYTDAISRWDIASSLFRLLLFYEDSIEK
jgi:hypothetical protein